MKRTSILIAIAGTLVVGVARVCYWDAHPTVSYLAQPVSKAKAPTPATFADLPSYASSDQYAERIHALDRNVPEKEQRALVAWITNPKPTQFSDSAWRFLVNEVMDSLCHQDQSLSTWSDALMDIVRGKTNDPGVRDYAIQHLVERIQPVHLGEPWETNIKKRQAIIATMLDAAGATREGLSGTAIQGLHLILLGRQRSERQHEPSAKLPLPLSVAQLHPLAVSLAMGEEVPDSARITALQVCAQHGFREALPRACRIAGDANQPLILRLSAIAAIGELGKAEDRSLLETLQAEGQPRLSKALTPALKRLAARNNLFLN